MRFSPFAVAVVTVALTVGCDTSRAGAEQQPPAESALVSLAGASTDIPDYAPSVLRERAPANRAREDEVFNEAARAAWALVDRHYYASTGLVSAQPTWAYPTAWDIASTLAAYYSARGLGYLSEDEYRKRASLLLATMRKARLFNGIAYGRNYDAKTGELVGADQKPHPNGPGYSAIDLGRLLMVLAIVAKNDPSLAEAARAVAERVDGKRVLKDGYMIGTELSKQSGKQNVYQEGRLGYEQYAATGFSLWNMRPSQALNVRAHTKKAKVLGIPIWADTRGLDRLTSEPFILHGLEIGWDKDMRELAWQTLSAQAARFASTGQMTMASEDAINQPPYYFYYYCVYCSGKEFIISAHSPKVELDGPRWISTKAAFAWHALLPSKYTWQAIETVRPALDPTKGWASGLFERSNKSTATYSLNTAAVILEAALYRKTGKPLMAQAR